MSSLSSRVPYMLHSSKVEFSEDFIGKTRIEDVLRNLIVTPDFEIKLTDLEVWKGVWDLVWLEGKNKTEDYSLF